MLKRIIFSIFIILFSWSANAAIESVSVEVSWDKGALRLKKGSAAKTKIKYELPKGYHLYVDQTDLEFTALEGINVTNVKYPATMMKPDPLGGKPVSVYGSDGSIVVELLVPPSAQDGRYRLSAIFHYQACSKKFCLRPAQKDIHWNVSVGDLAAGEGAGLSLGARFSYFLDLVKGKTSSSVLNVDLKWLYLIAFLGGILSSFTPCILPLIPITLLIIGVNPKGSAKENFGLSLLLVIGMGVTYSTLGLIASGMGKSLGFVFQSRIFLLLVVIFLFAMALSLLGIYTFQLPKRFRELLSRLGGGGYRGAFLAGISMGLLATPCIGPVIAALLVYAASAKSMAISFSLLLAYSIGLGLVIIIAGTWYGTVTGRLKKAKVKWVKKLLGLLILIPALYYLHSLVPFTNLFMERAEHPIDWQPARSALARSVDSESKPKLLLFTADWCPPCKVLEALTLKDPEIVRLSNNFENIKVDTTKSTLENETLINRYDVKGWPTIIFASPERGAYRDLSISGGFITAGQLKKSMLEAIARSNGGA